jgi:hypothetical protein
MLANANNDTTVYHKSFFLERLSPRPRFISVNDAYGPTENCPWVGEIGFLEIRLNKTKL